MSMIDVLLKEVEVDLYIFYDPFLRLRPKDLSSLNQIFWKESDGLKRSD